MFNNWNKTHEDVLRSLTSVQSGHSKSQLISEPAPISWWLSWLSSVHPIGRSQPGCTVKAALTCLLFLFPLQALQPTSSSSFSRRVWLSQCHFCCLSSPPVTRWHHRVQILLTALILSPVTLLLRCPWRKGLKVNVSREQVDKPSAQLVRKTLMICLDVYRFWNIWPTGFNLSGKHGNFMHPSLLSSHK